MQLPAAIFGSQPTPATVLRVALATALALACAAAYFAYGFFAAERLASPAARPPNAAKAPPAVEPLVFAPVTPEGARKINAAIEFAPLGPAARPFVLTEDEETRARATDCLAAAMWYEAGDDRAGNRSVGQVVINRLRHPAYPASVCGVVFQGSERSTGCQFTFTCDGALARIPPPAAFARVRARAAEMLEGSVDPAVGLATHYHTDWVHPLWSAELEKIARVHTHLFFRWAGAWGGPRAQTGRHAGAEPAIPKLAPVSLAHRAVVPEALASGPEAAPALALTAGSSAAKVDPDTGVIRVEFSPQRSSDVQALAALDLCGDRAFCEINGVLAGAGPNAPKVFYFIRDRSQRIEHVSWDCTRFKRPTTTQCMYRREGK